MLSRFLSERPAFLTFFATVVAFCCYASMYAFRKAYQAADFAESPEVWDLTYKSVLVIVQVLGYALSKFIGIKIVSEIIVSSFWESRNVLPRPSLICKMPSAVTFVLHARHRVARGTPNCS